MKTFQKIASTLVLTLALGTFMAAVPAQAASVTYPYEAHVQDKGWVGQVGDGATAGTTGKGLRLEALRFTFPGQKARGHVQDIGWQAWQANDSTQVGTTGKSKALEAIQLVSTVPGKKLICQAHVQNKGWTAWVKDGEVCGTVGKGLRLEAVRIKLVDDGTF